jgi:hypothetical protein
MALYTASHRPAVFVARPLRCVTGIDDFERRAGRQRLGADPIIA